MKNYVVLCICSALGGAAATLLISSSPPLSNLAAQEARLPRTAGSERAQPTPRALAATRLPVNELTAEEHVNVGVYENVNRSVVNINTKTVRTDNLFMFEVPSEGAGSGSVIDTRGHVLTNYHVVDGAREIQVTLFDGKSYEATLVGKDELTDVAVLRIEAPASSLMPVVFGNSDHLKVGQKVYAIGNPFGLERTLTTGIISSLNRSLPTRSRRTIKSIIQIDAAINPGNSGGPLLDTRSRLIGMNTAIASATGQSAGVGFAVPVDAIARVVPQLIERGKVVRPDVGITRVMQTEQGLLIATMNPKGPAERAGLRGFRLSRQRKNRGPFTYETQSIDRTAADLIVAVDGKKITDANDFLSLIETRQPGEEVVLTIVRDGRELDVPVRLSAGES